MAPYRKSRFKYVSRLLPFLAGVSALLLVAVMATAQETKRVFIVQSYEEGHVCGEPQAEGVLKGLAAQGWVVGKNLSVKSYHMDTYRTNATPEAARGQGEIVLKQIAEFKPHVVVTLDDAAVQQVMLPLVGRPDVAIVFSGMNGQPETYNERKKFMVSRARPGSNVTGVYEKLYAAESLRVMARAIPGLRGGKVVMITDHSPTGNGLTRQFEIELKDVRDVLWEVRRVKDWEEYTALIGALNADDKVKAIYPVALTLPVSEGVRYAAAQIYDWTLEHSRKPEMAINYFFARMGLFGGATINFGSMGTLAGHKAGKILNGAAPGDLPIEDAPDYAIVFNLKRAKDLGITIPQAVLTAAAYVYKDDLRPLKGRALLYDPKTKSF
jgi:putative ABC transport system substrate-binding protein